MKSRLELILTQEEMKRITINERWQEITVDVHGLHKGEARRLIRNVIHLIRNAFTMTIVHGYNNGVALQQMFRSTFADHRVTGIRLIEKNQGVTEYDVTAA